MNPTVQAHASQAELTARWVLFFETLGVETQAGPGWIYLADPDLFVNIETEPVGWEDAEKLSESFGESQTVQVLVSGPPSADSRPLVRCNDMADSSAGESTWGADEPTAWALAQGRVVVQVQAPRGRFLCDGAWETCRGLLPVTEIVGPDEHVAMAAQMAVSAGLYAFPIPRNRETP